MNMAKIVTPLQAQIVELQKEFRSSFKSFAFLKKKYDDQATALYAVHSKLRVETSYHSNDVEQFRSIIRKLEGDLSRAQRDLETTNEATIAEYKEFEAFQMEIADYSAKASKIAFSSLLGQLVHDHPALDLSSYTLEDVLGASAPEALLVILEDRPPKAIDVEAKREMDSFVEELNKVLTFDSGMLEEGEITTIPSDL